MSNRRCTVVNGQIGLTGTLAVELILSAQQADRLSRRSIWIPRQSIEGGSIIRTGDTDPAISNWWLKQRGIFDLITPASPAHP